MAVARIVSRELPHPDGGAVTVYEIEWKHGDHYHPDSDHGFSSSSEIRQWLSSNGHTIEE